MFTVGVVTKDIELSQLQLRSVFRQLGYCDPPTAEFELPLHHCLAIWVSMLLLRLKFLATEQRQLLFEELVKQLDDKLVTEITNGTALTPLVVIADGRYAAWHNRTGWLDLTTGETLKQPRVAPLETLGYNLASLFLRNKTACELLQQRTNQYEHTTSS